MNNRLKGWIRSFLSLNKSEQRGIIILTVLILIVGIINLILPYIIKPQVSPQFSVNMKIVNEFIAEQERIKDSIKQSKSINKVITTDRNKLFYFDPNTSSDSTLLLLGLSKKQIANIRNYLLKGGKFYSKTDLKKMYTITEEDYLVLEPYIIIETNKKEPTHEYYLTELNTADSTTLIQNLKFSPHLASRILKYRNLLGGYYSKNQLYEVYGINKSHLRKIDSYITIDTTYIRKININTISFKGLLRHPYFDYNTTKDIINARYKSGEFETLYQIKESSNLSDSAFRKQKFYLYIRPHKIKTDTI